MKDSLPLKFPDSSGFLMMLGKCITDWAMIEEQLFHICHEILGVTLEQCAIIYYRTPTLDTRLRLVDELLVEFFPKPERRNGGHGPKELDDWATLLRDIRKELPIRNQLAHQPVGVSVYGSLNQDGDVVEIGMLQVESYPHRAELARPKSDGKLSLSISDLEEYQPKILALYNRVNEFRQGPLKAHISKRRKAQG